MNLKKNSRSFLGLASLVCAVAFSLFSVSAHAQTAGFTISANVYGGCGGTCKLSVAFPHKTVPITITNNGALVNPITVNLNTVFGQDDDGAGILSQFMGVSYSSSSVTVYQGSPVTVNAYLTDSENTDSPGWSGHIYTDGTNTNNGGKAHTSNIIVLIGN